MFEIQRIDFLELGADLMAVNAARISYSKWHEKIDPDTDPRLLKYLIKHNHWTPLAHYPLGLLFSRTPHWLGQRVINFPTGVKIVNKGMERYLLLGSWWWWANSLYIPSLWDNQEKFIIRYWLEELGPESYAALKEIRGEQNLINKVHLQPEGGLAELQDRIEVFFDIKEIRNVYSIRIKAPVWMWDQIKTHREFLISSESRRYITTEPEFYIPEVLHKAPEHSKQGSGVAFIGDDLRTLRRGMEWDCKTSMRAYDLLCKEKVAPEEARMILPQAMYSTRIVTAHKDYWEHVFSLRLRPNAQNDTRKLFEQIYGLIRVAKGTKE